MNAFPKMITISFTQLNSLTSKVIPKLERNLVTKLSVERWFSLSGNKKEGTYRIRSPRKASRPGAISGESWAEKRELAKANEEKRG